jgi:hypothetical protein
VPADGQQAGRRDDGVIRFAFDSAKIHEKSYRIVEGDEESTS